VRGWLYKCEQLFEIDHVVDPHKDLHIVIDTGSTHNFLDVNKAKQLGCHFSQTCPLKVDIPDVAQLTSRNMYELSRAQDGIQISWKESSFKGNKEVLFAMDGRLKDIGTTSSVKFHGFVCLSFHSLEYGLC
ncbi:hypothetical protein Tco_0253948, partial [Tanacetum coccineum]